MIECLASNGIFVTETDLMALPLAIKLDPQLRHELGELVERQATFAVLTTARSPDSTGCRNSVLVG